MRMAVVVSALLLTWGAPALAQDQAELQKQLTALLASYPKGFADLKDPSVVAGPSRFHLTGGLGDTFVLGEGAKAYVSVGLGTPRSAADAKAGFDRWVGVLDHVELNGVKLVGSECEPDEFNAHCRVWSLDDSKPLDPAIRTFRVVLATVNVMGSYAASVLIGGV